MENRIEQHEAVARIADFDHVFAVLPDGIVAELDDYFDTLVRPFGPRPYAPEAIDPDPDATTLDGWDLPLSGFTGQHGYNGPWLHDSEVIVGGVADYVLDHPGYWVAIYAQYTCNRTPMCGDDCDTDIEGWTLAYRPFPN